MLKRDTLITSTSSPDFEHISAFGPTPEDALREVLIALEMTIEYYREQRMPLPEAKYRPAYMTE